MAAPLPHSSLIAFAILLAGYVVRTMVAWARLPAVLFARQEVA